MMDDIVLYLVRDRCRSREVRILSEEPVVRSLTIVLTESGSLAAILPVEISDVVAGGVGGRRVVQSGSEDPLQ